MKTRHLIVIALTLLPCLFTTAKADSFSSGDNAFDIDFVMIGNPGNAPDTTGRPNPAGSVDYVYRMGKYEIGRAMVEKASAAGGLGIDMSPDFPQPGLPVPGPDTPADWVSWNEAARFVNWLNTSKGFSAAYRFSTQPGDAGYDANENPLLWEVGDSGYDATNPYRNRQAFYFLPSADEWYKSAYYDPSANGGAGGYWDFPTGSDTLPTSVDSGTDEGTAVYGRFTPPVPPDLPMFPLPADIMQAGGLSPYGTMAQGGNVWEWNETCSLEIDLCSGERPIGNPYMRGGDVSIADVGELSSSRLWGSTFGDFPRAGAQYALGFRVASVPEPSSQLLGLLGVIGLLLRKRRLSHF